MKVALVTGSAKRVGKTIAVALARKGYAVVVHYKTSKKEALQTAAEIKQLGRKALVVQADISQEREVTALFNAVRKHFSRLDVLVNSAAVFYRTPFETITEKDWNVHLNTNVKGTFFCCRAAVEIMKKQGSGIIINIADYAAEHPYKNYLPYSVSKAGVVALTKALAQEAAPKIKVYCISPRVVVWPEEYTEEQKKRILQHVPGKKIGRPEDVAEEILMLLGEDSSLLAKYKTFL